MKTKILFLICMITISIIPANFVQSQNEDNVPEAPEFLALVPNDEGQHFFDVNETVKIQYETDRFSVEGVVIVGNGSGLQSDPEHENATQLERASSFQGRSTWEIEINVTSYTYFYAFSWYNEITNRTMEELDLLDGALGHQMWLNIGPSYPSLYNVTNSTPENSGASIKANTEFYTPRYENTTIVFDVSEQNNETKFVTLSLSNSSEGVFNASTSIRVNMTQIVFSENSHSRYEYEINMTQRIIYFAAFSEHGWERTLESVPTPVTRSINTGFSVNATFSESITDYTTLDTISFNVTSSNETVDDLFSYRFRYFKNSTSEDPLVDWQDVSIDVDFLETITYNETLDNANHTQTDTVYRVVLDMKFNISQVVHIQPYVTYFDVVHNDTLRIIEIHDPNPSISILTANDTMTSGGSAFVDWEFTSVRGTITNATLISNQTEVEVSLTSLENYTYSFENDTDIIEGYHLVTINVTSTFSILNVTNSNFSRYDIQVWNITTLVFQVDITKPTGNFVNPPTTSTAEGRVTLSFTFSDAGISPTGIDLAKLDWGDNTAVNVTSRSQASHLYRRSGTYTIRFTMWDKVGNSDNFTIQIEVTVPTTEQTTTQESPVSVVSMISALTFLVIVIRISKKNNQFR